MNFLYLYLSWISGFCLAFLPSKNSSWVKSTVYDFWVCIYETFMMERYLFKMMNRLADLSGRELHKYIKLYRLGSFIMHYGFFLMKPRTLLEFFTAQWKCTFFVYTIKHNWETKREGKRTWVWVLLSFVSYFFEPCLIQLKLDIITVSAAYFLEKIKWNGELIYVKPLI